MKPGAFSGGNEVFGKAVFLEQSERLDLVRGCILQNAMIGKNRLERCRRGSEKLGKGRMP